MPMDKCPKCGSTDIDVNGHLMGRLRVNYMKDLKGIKFGFVRGQAIKAFSCNNCGYIEFYRELKK